MNLAGKLLIAMPGMGDPRFEHSVVFMCAHSPDGAMGLIVNKPAPDLSFGQLLDQLGITQSDRSRDIRIHLGGPVEHVRGFVLHSSDYYVENSTLPIDNKVSLTATLDILKAIAHGDGPRNALLALGYAGWAPGQLENEIQKNGWLHCPADADLIFGADIASKYERALKKLGIDIAMLSNEAGHA